MRVLYYCLPSFMANAASEIRALSRHAEIHLVFEVSPKAWRHNVLDLPHPPWEPGFHEGRKFLREHLPADAWAYFAEAAGVYFSTYPPGLSAGSTRAVWSTIRAVGKIAPDVLHLGGESIRAACWVPLVRRPLVVGVHEPQVPMGSNLPALAWAKRLLIPRAKHIVVHSEECRNAIIAQGRVPARRITKAVLGPMEIVKAWLPDDSVAQDDSANQILFWGNLSIRKGVDLLLAAAPKVAEQIAHVRFVIAGQPVGEYRIPPLPHMPNDGKITVIIERIPNARLAQMVSAATIVAAPYRDAMQSAVILTAYAFAKPVVASDVGGLPEQVWHNETGLLFANGDADGLAKAVVQLLTDNSARQRMQKRIQELNQTALSWDDFGTTVAQVWRKVAGESS